MPNFAGKAIFFCFYLKWNLQLLVEDVSKIAKRQEPLQQNFKAV